MTKTDGAISDPQPPKSTALHPAYSVSNIQTKIRTLDGSKVTYSSWVKLFKFHAIAYKVLVHLDDTPAPIESDPAFEAWNELDALVSQWIYSTISDDLLTRVLDTEATARTTWLKLEKIFLSNKQAKATALETRFVNLTLATCSSVDDYCQQLKELANQLVDVDQPITENRLVLQLVRGLSPEFDTIASLINSQNADWDLARTMLTDEVIRLEARKQQSTLVLVTPAAPPPNSQPDQQNSQQPQQNHRGQQQNRGRGQQQYRGRGGRGRGNRKVNNEDGSWYPDTKDRSRKRNNQIIAMNEKRITGSCMVKSNEKTSSLYPMLVGVSCALFSFKHLLNRTRTEITDEMVHGGATLMGLLLWRVQREEQVKTDRREILNKLKNAETEVKELKRRRVEDAKANEKVVGIFASHEQRWITQKKKLTQQISLLLKELQVINTKREETISELHGQLQEKDKLLEEEKSKRREQEEAVRKVEEMNQVWRETLKREAQEHSKEIWKHKSAFIELVSTQRQLEAEMGRAVRQVEAEKQELDAVLEQKEQYVLMTQKLSMELIKTRKDLEQKDKILSAMLRKSKVDSAEKQMLLKEVKISKSKRQQAAVQTEKSKTVSESRYEKYSLRSMLSRHHKSKPEATAVPSVAAIPSQPTNPHEFEQSELEEEQDVVSPFSQQPITEAKEELADIRQLEGWVQCEAEKYIGVVEERHQLEVNAFAEQLRLKDEKLEAFRWHSVSMDIELKRLQSQIEGLTHDLTKLKEHNLKVDALLLERESELHALKDQMESESYIRTRSITHDQEVCLEEITEEKAFKDTVLTVQSPDKEFEDNKNTSLNLISVGEECGREKDIQSSEYISTTWKMDLHALGVFYKIKRLNQQLLMFERLTGKHESCENCKRDDTRQFYSLMCLVNKQVNRYQSLQEKANDICKRMHENDQDASSGRSIAAKSKEETKKLEHFLEETFQLQRYIVATGQKLMEIQSKIASGFVGVQDDEFAASFDMKKFADCLRTLFREVQRGLEVRISRIIGDLEGPLAWDGMIHRRN
ncbi:hypothetical protein L1987_35540 [Smallanthus sonchifolius]|uniref:Uncharacterized protein n=1 Tax=Smallanthus sonchifolius TaxID=185202 RepID=A0ACB9HWA7_9ASTR|nr:hypothetical protein L1987_35540 [Smallanthus sonchifolius]